ncbi:hypothetical protein MMC17_003228 [Xylographa soralifera]|nr:hypothetical protein [Xylographa soralifera]
MAAQGVAGPPFPILPPQAPRRLVPTGQPVYTQPQPFASKYYQHTSRLLSISLDLRRKILEYVVVSHDEVGVKIPLYDPAYLFYRGWIDDVSAQNDFVFTDISQARFLKRCVYQWDQHFFANMRNLHLGPYFMVPYTCATTEPSEMLFYYEDFLIAMRPFWGITRLEITLPWDFELQKWREMMGFVHGAFPNLTEFAIDRPDVDFLLPDAIGVHVPFGLPENSYNTQFWTETVTNHPLGFVFPTNISQILLQTDQDINFLNDIFVPMGRPKLRHTLPLEAIRDIWRDSPDGSAPSPGYDSETRKLIGGEERRRMFPQYYFDDPPPEPAQTPTQELQPDEDLSQPYHFQQL